MEFFASMGCTVSDHALESFRPFAKLLIVGSVAGDVLFLHTAGTHKAPFVVVTAQPYLSNVVELPILGDAVSAPDRHTDGNPGRKGNA